MSLGTRLFTWLHGEFISTDAYGNRYFRAKGGRRRSDGKERRWVVYAGEPDGSKVPPEWNAWLHHTTAVPPTDGGSPKAPWQTAHVPNLTGTAQAYRPPGHVAMGGQRAAATGDYEPWRPT
jgi:NADH:ubiquinone oxidoreductase subunit